MSIAGHPRHPSRGGYDALCSACNPRSEPTTEAGRALRMYLADEMRANFADRILAIEAEARDSEPPRDPTPGRVRFARCPVCGSLGQVVGTTEGTQHFEVDDGWQERGSDD